MKIPLLDMKAQIKPIRKEIDRAIKGVIDNGGFILGNEVKLLEKEIAAHCNVKYVIGVSNGTDAIILSLIAMGLNKGDGVICPSFTYYATAGAIIRAGAVPVFADVDPKTYCISTDSILKILRTSKSKQQAKIQAIMPVHLYGQCANMAEILKIAKQYKLKVIEDTAQAFGAAYKNKIAGTLGDCGTVSFFPGKNLGAFGDAGCILTNKKAIANKLSCLRNQGASSNNKYKHLSVGSNARLDTIQGAILRVKLKHISRWNNMRDKNADYYNKELQNTDITTPFVAKENIHVYHQYVLRVRKNKEKIRQYLIRRGIDSRTYYPIPLHLQSCFKDLGYKKGDFPESEKCAMETFAIPVYPELTKKQMDYVITSIKKAN